VLLDVCTIFLRFLAAIYRWLYQHRATMRILLDAPQDIVIYHNGAVNSINTPQFNRLINNTKLDQYQIKKYHAQDNNADFIKSQIEGVRKKLKFE